MVDRGREVGAELDHGVGAELLGQEVEAAVAAAGVDGDDLVRPALLVENYATELGSWPELIATGGDAATLFTNWELVHAISPDLTLYGIALAYAEHHIKNDSEGGADVDE